MKVYRLSGTVVNSEDAAIFEALNVDYISASLIDKYLIDAGGEDVTFNLNSGGGSVFAGTEIYTMLRSYTGKVTINITGLSASIASVFMCGADEVNIAHHAMVMVHRPSLGYSGELDEQGLDRLKGMLSSTEKSIVSVYSKRTGLPEDELYEMMFNETWLSAEDAVAKGFVDNIIEDNSASTLSDKMVAMVENASTELELVNILKGKQMDKSLLEKVKAIVSGGFEPVEHSAEQQPQEVAEEEVVAEEVVTEEVVAEETPAEENETEKLIKEAMEEITSLRAQNERLTKEVAELKETNNSLTAKNSKSESVMEQLNELLNGTTDRVVVSQAGKVEAKGTMPTGYQGFRGGN